MEESRICRQGVKAVMLYNSQSNSILQHQDSNFGGISNKYSLDEDEGSDFIIKNSNLMSPLLCTQESREKPPQLDAGTEPCDGPQESECTRNKGKTLGNHVCSVAGHFHTRLLYLCFPQHMWRFEVDVV